MVSGMTTRYSLLTEMNDAALETIAENVRAARAAAGLSLDALAGRAEVSKGALVALEGARGNPNLTTLVRVADALGRSVSSLMEDVNESAALIVDADEVEPLWVGPQGGTARLLLTNPRPSPVEVWRWTLYRGAAGEPRAPCRCHRDAVGRPRPAPRHGGGGIERAARRRDGRFRSRRSTRLRRRRARTLRADHDRPHPGPAPGRMTRQSASGRIERRGPRITVTSGARGEGPRPAPAGGWRR